MGRPLQKPNAENCKEEEFLILIQKGNLETQKRATGIWMLVSGQSREKVYSLLHVTDRVVRKWISLFNQSGIDGLIAGKRPGPPKKIKQELHQRICTDLENPIDAEERTFWTARSFHGYLAKKYQVECSYRTVVRFFHDQNFSLQVPRPWSDKKDEAARKDYRIQLKSLCEQADVDIWYCDETGIYGESKPYRRWAAKGSKPKVVRNGAHTKMSVVGMVCPRTGQFFALETSGCDTQIFQAFLDEAAKCITFERKRNIVIADNASWHKPKCIDWHGFEKMFLPPYSPDLNPIERIWLVMKMKWFNNAHCDTIEKLIDRLDLALLDLINNSHFVKSVTQNFGTE